MDRNVERVLREALGDAEFQARLESGHFTPTIACPESERQVRDEYARESDIAYQIKQFGAGRAFPRQGYSGLLDDSVDLLRAHELLDESVDLWNQMPQEIRREFRSFAELEAARAAGAWPPPPSAPPVPPAVS